MKKDDIKEIHTKKWKRMYVINPQQIKRHQSNANKTTMPNNTQ